MKKIKDSKQKYKSEFHSLRFKNSEDFDEWLKKTTDHTITFRDRGQDCLTWYIDAGGEVLHASLQAWIWNGRIVDLSKLRVGNNIETINFKKRTNIVLDFIIKSIK